MTTTQKRLIYVAAFLLLLGIEIAIARFTHDRFVRPYVGDVLVVILIGCFMRIFLPKRPRLLSLYVFVFATAVEVLQFLNWTHWLGVHDNHFLRTLLGTTFSWGDIVCYAVGCGTFWLCEELCARVYNSNVS